MVVQTRTGRSADKAKNLAGAVLRAARDMARMSQAELARRSGVSQPVISAYERARRQPTLASLYVLVAATEVPFETALERAQLYLDRPGGRGWRPPSVAELSGDVRDALAAGNEAEALRYLGQLQDDFYRADEGQRAVMVSHAPDLVGDGRFDAAIAGLVEHLCVACHLEVPAWTAAPERFAATFWFGGAGPEHLATRLRDTPVSLARRGVFLSKNDLVRV